MSDPSFLIVRFSAIGDCVMAVPVASRIRRGYPSAFVAWAIESRCAEVVDTQSLVNLRKEFPRGDWSRKAGPADWGAQVRAALALRKRRFDFGLDLQGHAKTALVLRLARPKKMLAVQAWDPLVRRLAPVMEPLPGDLHTVERNLLALSRLVTCDADATPIMPSLEDQRAKVRALAGDSKPLATLTVGAGSPDKAYPIERWAQVAALLDRRGFRVAFLGGPTDPSAPTGIGLDLVGRTQLSETMAWVAESAIHLAADTGTGHIAAAYGVPVVSVFGPMNPGLFRPYTQRGIVLRVGDNPAEVPPEQVVEAALALREGSARAISR